MFEGCVLSEKGRGLPPMERLRPLELMALFFPEAPRNGEKNS